MSFSKILPFALIWVSLSASAESKPPLMPARLADDTQTSGAETESGESAFPVRLGVQLGAIAFASPGALFTPADTYVGGRFFSRFALMDRVYFIPSVGFYRLMQGPQVGLGAPNLLDFGAQVHVALLRLGPVGLMAGLNQRLSAEFFADASGLRGNWYYRLGPGANVNIRFNSSVSALVGADLTFPLNQALPSQWTGHAGLLIGF